MLLSPPTTAQLLSSSPSSPSQRRHHHLRTTISSRNAYPCRPLHPVRLSARSYGRRTGLAASFSSAEAAVEATGNEGAAEEEEEVEKKRMEVVVNTLERPRLVLKFVWMEKYIGLGLDQAVPGHGTLPLSPYYFWPRKDAWEELKTMLETKPWISQRQSIILLNQATDIINLWQQSGGRLVSAAHGSHTAPHIVSLDERFPCTASRRTSATVLPRF